PISAISAAYQCRLSVPVSAAYQCQSVPPISAANQCCLSVPSVKEKNHLFTKFYNRN
ncbi:unnamed protein product, partial [Staurois parvus]